MGGLDIIMTCDFYQTPPIIWDSWIFKFKIDGFNVLTTIFLCKNVKCYELKQVMRQNDLEFINILEKVSTTP